VIIRENTEDLTRDRVRAGTPENARVRELLEELGSHVREDSGISIKPISVFGSSGSSSTPSITQARGRRKVTAVHRPTS